eukprot:TRINITY_DN891_c0_g1_i8.p1 TRINITY_DN891_c0_g1~~TRINITY_DN891_c0_g1_i8.p1  ORF type:complete len:141 (-),score=11.07 TRINITY_DN891_c0_g1_i8:613-1035(-)
MSSVVEDQVGRSCRSARHLWATKRHKKIRQITVDQGKIKQLMLIEEKSDRLVLIWVKSGRLLLIKAKSGRLVCNLQRIHGISSAFTVKQSHEISVFTTKRSPAYSQDHSQAISNIFTKSAKRIHGISDLQHVHGITAKRC